MRVSSGWWLCVVLLVGVLATLSVTQDIEDDMSDMEDIMDDEGGAADDQFVSADEEDEEPPKVIERVSHITMLT